MTKVNIEAVTDTNRPRHARHEPEFDDEFDIFDEDSADRGYIDDRGSRSAQAGDGYAEDEAGAGEKSWRREAPKSGVAGAAAATGAASAGAAAHGRTAPYGDVGPHGDAGPHRYAEPQDGATTRDDSTSHDGAATDEKPGPPLRGLAMILLAVGVLLVGWGAFSLYGDKGGDDAKNTAQNQSAENNGQPEQANPAGQSGQANSNASGEAAKDGEQRDGAGNPNDPKNTDNPNDPNKRDGAKPGEQGANAPEAPAGNAGGAARGVVNKENEYVTVLNNSPIRGLAGDTAKKLSEKQWAKTGYGNLADTSGTFPQSVVLYPGDNPNARAAAEQIASDLGLKAQPRDGRIDETLRGAKMLEGGAPAAVVVVTTNDMPR